MPPDPALAYARDLERLDVSLAAEIREVDALQRASEDVGARAAAAAAFLAGLPGERAALEAALADAERELEQHREELRTAEAALERARAGRDEANVRAAERALRATNDALSTSQLKMERASSATARLEAQAEAVAADAAAAERDAHELAGRLTRLARISREGAVDPRPGLAGVVAWASKARAALFVVRGALDGERERVVRQANELGASALGEPLYATSVTRVRERLEAASGA